MKKLIIAATMLLAMMASDAMAQTASRGRMPRKVHRQRHQMHRINNGVATGSVTKGEARELKAQQDRIDENKQAARKDGVVTSSEKRSLDRQQDRASRNIRSKKHNSRVRH